MQFIRNMAVSCEIAKVLKYQDSLRLNTVRAVSVSGQTPSACLLEKHPNSFEHRRRHR